MLITIAGNIGSGKSSLTLLLHQKFGWQPYFESVDDNPYLADFYADMPRWSFHLQVYFLSQRFMTHKRIAASRGTVVQDRSIYEDAEIFAHNLHDMGRMDDRDYANYRALYAAMTGYLTPPSLMVYLRADVPTLLRQIRLRGRDFEQGIEEEYLARLGVLYEEWIAAYATGPLLVVDTRELDFVHRPQDQEELVYRITNALPRKHPY
jgi:deoxyadenosine/deoxycytidine kinase